MELKDLVNCDEDIICSDYHIVCDHCKKNLSLREPVKKSLFVHINTPDPSIRRDIEHAIEPVLFKASRVWNRLAYAVMKLGRRMIWDQTGRNRDLLDDMKVTSKASKSIMCNW